jgi:hypothetical protein
MATDAVTARTSSGPIVEAWWFRFLVRTALALLAFWMLSFAADRFTAFLLQAAEERRYDGSMWLWWAGATVAAGILFGLATCPPFVKIRFLPSRLLLAAVALVPVAHLWWVLIEDGAASGGWLGRFYWFDEGTIQFPMAALAGVAIASSFTAEREHPATDAVPARTSSDSIIHTRWFHVLVRTALAGLAFVALWFAADRLTAAFVAQGHEVTGAEVTGTRVAIKWTYDGSLWLSWIGVTVAAGLLFGLATWLPFAKIRVVPSRLLLAAVALVPVAHFWWADLEGHAASGDWLGRAYWFDAFTIQFVGAALAGVAIASGFRAKRVQPVF